MIKSPYKQSKVKRKAGKYSYFQQDLLGKGFSGKVFQGFINSGQKQGMKVAVKVIPKDKQNIVQQQRILKDQIKIHEKFKNNQHIVQLLDYLSTQNNFYIITELCPDRTLKQILQQNIIISEKQAIHFIKQIIKGYQSFYQLNILHRDIKPQNIFLSGSNLKIGDFGFAIKQSDLTEDQQFLIGSPAYMPAQTLMYNKYSHKGDIWAIGVTFVELLTGKLPFKGKKAKQLVKQFKDISLKSLFPKHISNETINIISKMLEIDKNLRIDFPSLKIEIEMMDLPLFTQLKTKQISASPTKLLKKSDIKDVNKTVNAQIHVKSHQHLKKITIFEKQPIQQKRIGRNQKKKKEQQIKYNNKTINLFIQSEKPIQKFKKISINRVQTKQSKETNPQLLDKQQDQQNNEFKAMDIVKQTSQQEKDQLTKNNLNPKKILNMYVSQLHLCRYGFKLYSEIVQLLKIKDSNIQESFMGFIFYMLIEIEQLSHLSEKYALIFRKSDEYTKLVKLIDTYILKYQKKTNKIQYYPYISQSKMIEVLQNQIVKLYQKLYIKDKLIGSSSNEILILDRLVTYLKMINLLQSRGLNEFYKISKIDTIVESQVVFKDQNIWFSEISQKMSSLCLI